MTFRVEQAQAHTPVVSGGEAVSVARSATRPAIAAVPNPTWQRLTSATGSSTGGALAAPVARGASLRGDNRSGSRRADLLLATAKLEALQQIAAASLEDVAPEHREAVRQAFAGDIAVHAQYCASLTG